MLFRCPFAYPRVVVRPQVLVLGPVEVRSEHGPVRLSPLGRRLVAVLAADAATTVSMDRLVDALWDGEAPADVRNRVQAAVSAVRRSLVAQGDHRPVIVTADPGYALSPDVRLDVTEFVTKLREARTLSAADDRVAAAALFRTALNTWRG